LEQQHHHRKRQGIRPPLPGHDPLTRDRISVYVYTKTGARPQANYSLVVDRGLARVGATTPKSIEPRWSIRPTRVTPRSLSQPEGRGLTRPLTPRTPAPTIDRDQL